MARDHWCSWQQHHLATQNTLVELCGSDANGSGRWHKRGRQYGQVRAYGQLSEHQQGDSMDKIWQAWQQVWAMAALVSDDQEQI
jgi:hypothetical protein